jgi:outer membrane protein assembly factor BamE
MRAVISVFIGLLLLLPLAGCELVYKLPTRQGNVLDQKDLDKVQLGMDREQVRFLLGTPLAATGLQSDRWDYYGYYKPPRGEARSRTVSLWFEADKLVKMEGEKPLEGYSSPEAQALKDAKKAEAAEKTDEPAKKDGILTPPDQQEHKDGGGGKS